MNFTYSDRMSRMSGSATREILKITANPEIISFAGGIPGSECFPYDRIEKAAARILSGKDRERVLQYGVTYGLMSAREAVRAYVGTIGIKTGGTGNVIIVSGGQQGLDLMCKVFLNKGDTVLVENPTYLAFLQIAASYEANAVGVDSDENGIVIEDLEAKIIRHKPKLLYLVPTFSNPTGKTYSEKNRIAIAELTKKYNITVVEDDPYSRLRYSGTAVSPLYNYCEDNCVYITSFSKVISPGLRVGACVGSEELIRKLEIAKQGSDVHSSHLSQAIIEDFITSGDIYKHIDSLIPVYKRKKDAMIRAIGAYMPPQFTMDNADGGLFIFGRFAADIDTVKLFPRATEQKVAYVYGNVFYADGSGLNTMRLNFSAPSPEQIEQGIKSLAEVVKSELIRTEGV